MTFFAQVNLIFGLYHITQKYRVVKILILNHFPLNQAGYSISLCQSSGVVILQATIRSFSLLNEDGRVSVWFLGVFSAKCEFQHALKEEKKLNEYVIFFHIPLKVEEILRSHPWTLYPKGIGAEK